MLRALVPLAQGCEELEAITITDLLVRAGIEVTTAGLDESVVTASRGARLVPDTTIEKVKDELFDLLALPGGLPGANHLRDDPHVQALLKKHADEHKLVAAICAAPKALAAAGLLEDKKFTCYPGALDEFRFSNCRYEDICPLYFLFQIRRSRMASGHGRVFSKKEQRNRQSDNI